MTYKYIFDTDRGKVLGREEDLYKGFKVQDFRALKILIQLLDENEGLGVSNDAATDDDELDTEQASEPCKFKLKSQKFPNLQTCPAIWAFLKQTKKQIENFMFPKAMDNNMSRIQQQALAQITSNDELIVKPSDKGGKCGGDG